MPDILDRPTSGTRTVTAFFDTEDHARKAKDDLVAAGLPADGITIVGSGAETFQVEPDRQQGLWQSFINFLMPDDDRRTYLEGLRRGGFALSVRADAAAYDHAIDILDRDGAVDLEQRGLDWEREGWDRNVEPLEPSYAPADASTAGFGGSRAGEDGVARVDEATNPDVRERIGVGTASQTAPSPTGGPQTYGLAATADDDAVADSAEGRPGAPGGVGRRDTEHGRTRVRSYIVEGDVNR